MPVLRHGNFIWNILNNDIDEQLGCILNTKKVKYARLQQRLYNKQQRYLKPPFLFAIIFA